MMSSNHVNGCNIGNDGWRHGLQEMHKFSEDFSEMEPQLTNISKLVTDELHQIDSKEAELIPALQHKVDKYKEFKRQLEQLKEEYDEHRESTAALSEDLVVISEELDEAKKRMNEKAGSMTDAKPLVDIRAAIQRLRSENKQLDVKIGILDYKLTQARTQEFSPQKDEMNMEE